jgi:hypothetical protein
MCLGVIIIIFFYYLRYKNYDIFLLRKKKNTKKSMCDGTHLTKKLFLAKTVLSFSLGYSTEIQQSPIRYSGGAAVIYGAIIIIIFYYHRHEDSCEGKKKKTPWALAFATLFT